MRGIVVISPNFFKFFAPNWAVAMAIFPFIIVKDAANSRNIELIQHESIHIRQQLEMLVVFFYLWYIIEYAIRWTQTQSRLEAYRNISFEKEAYAYQHDESYLQERPFWAYLRWL